MISLNLLLKMRGYCIAWLTLVVRAFGVTVLKYATDLALDEWMQQVIQRAGVVQMSIFAITNGIVVAKIIRYFCKKKIHSKQ